MYRMWAFWRRIQYVIGTIVVLCLFSAGFYYLFIYESPNCMDSLMNGDEKGIDCGGVCERICASDVQAPMVKWVRSFRITGGFYNAVAYITNKNLEYGTKELKYTFTLYDGAGATITTRSGQTYLPPDSEYPIFEGRVATGERQVAKTLLTLEPITEWRVFDSRRDQFIVNNRALRDVDSRPRLDASLTNTLLEDLYDVAIVATIFDRRGTALTASETQLPLFEGRSQKNVVFTWPEPIAKTIRSCEVPSDVILAVDLSGSMNNDGGNPPEPITSSLHAAGSFITRLGEKEYGAQDQVGIVTFATNAALAKQLSNDKTTAVSSISKLTIDPKEERGSTNVGDAINFAYNEFLSARHSKDARKVLVLFTDGLATGPDPDPEGYALTAAKKAKDDDVTIFTIGLGNEVNKEFLATLASGAENRFLAANTDALDSIYRSISTAICEEGAAVIDIVPKIIGGLNDRK